MDERHEEYTSTNKRDKDHVHELCNNLGEVLSNNQLDVGWGDGDKLRTVIGIIVNTFTVTTLLHSWGRRKCDEE